MCTYLVPATAAQWQDICADVGATEESLKKDVHNLKEWLEKQPHLPNITDDEFLTNFLIRCKNSVESAHQYLDSYYTARAIMSDIIMKRDPASESVQKYGNVVTFMPLPKLTPEGYRVWIQKMDESLKHHTPNTETVLEMTTMLMDFSIKHDRNKSLIYIYNFENMTLSYMAQVFTVLKRYVTFGTKSCPARIHKIYILNLNTTFESLINAAKSFANKKIANRFEIWKKKPEDLVEVLPKDILPSDFGGYEKSFNELKDSFLTYFKELHDWFESEKQLIADLSKKPNDDGTPNRDIIGEFGVEGSFRKINID